MPAETEIERLAEAIESVGTEIRFLGNGNADRGIGPGAGPGAGWGAIEAHGDALRQAGENVTAPLSRLADAAEGIAAGIFELARAIRGDAA